MGELFDIHRLELLLLLRGSFEILRVADDWSGHGQKTPF